MKRIEINLLDISVLFLIVSSAAYFFSFFTADPDLWGHIKFGADLWKDKHIAQTDPYSFTASGQTWINHEWLTELIFYFTYRFFGSPGLLFGKLLVGILTVAFLIMTCNIRYNKSLVFVFVMILAVFVISPGFMIRPQIFSFLFFSIFSFLLHLYFSKKKNMLFLLPFVMVAWVNLHGGFLMGWVLLIIATCSKTLESLILHDDHSQLKSLWLWFILSSLAVLINPYGYKLLVFLSQTLAVPRNISEWAPMTLLDLSYLRFKIMAVLFLFVFVLKFKKAIGWEVAAIAAILIASLQHQRHTPFFGMIAAPFIANHISTLVSEIVEKYPGLHIRKNILNLLAVLISLVALWQTGTVIYRYNIAKCQIIVGPNEYPIAAVQFLKENDIDGNILVPFNWGEYVIWKRYPNSKVSIDGRFRTVYPESVIQNHFIPLEDTEKWNHLIAAYPAADIILAEQSSFFNEFINNQKEWIYVYSDKIGIIFVRDNEKNKQTIERLKKDRKDIKDPLSVFFP